jgi:hypothetical protein
VTAGCDVAADDTCAVTIGDTSVGEAEAGVLALENTATEPGDGVVTVGSVTDLAACVGEEMLGSAVAFGDDFWVPDFGWVTAEVCFGVFVDSGSAVLVGLVVLAVAGAVVVLMSVDPPVLDPLVADVPDEDGVDAVSSAVATPYPVAIAVPTPNATASPPTRPMWAAAPMVSPPRTFSPVN